VFEENVPRGTLPVGRLVLLSELAHGQTGRRDFCGNTLHLSVPRGTTPEANGNPQQA
jgi:hypothetical protein